MKKISKLLLISSSFALIGASCLLSSCSSSNSSDPIVENNAFVKLANTNLELTVGQSALLGVTISGGSADTKLSFSVENEKIVSVTSGGLVTALDFGRTEIKATYGKSIAKCVVNVVVNDNIPVVDIQNIEERSVKIDLLTHIQLKPRIIYNNTAYEFTPTYMLSDASVGEMDGNTFIPKANGTEYITIKGVFHGLQAVSTTLEVIIQDNVVIYMKDEDNIEQNEVILYSDKGYDEETFRTSFKPSFGVFVNHEKIDSPDLVVDVVDDDGVVIFDAVSKEVKSTSKVGMASYKIKYTDENGNEFLKYFDIFNNKSIFEYKGDIIETDSINGILPLEDIFAKFSDKQIDRITNLDGTISYDIESGAVKGLPVVYDSFGYVDVQQFIVYNKTVGYKVKLRVFTKIIKDVSDLDYFHLESRIETKFPGYYVLDNNIDGAGYELKPHDRTMGDAYLSYPNVGLTGTFDGRGHTIKNVSIGEGGIFGNVGKGGTIKNVGFKDIVIRQPGKAGGDDVAIIATYVNGAIFDNVYISNSNILAGYNAGLVACNIMNNCLFANCMFECFMANELDIKSPNYGVFGSMCGEKNSLPDGFMNVYKDVVVNSNLPLVKSSTNASGGLAYIMDTFERKIEGYDTYILKSGIIRFVSEEEMHDSGETFESFSTEYWEVNDHILMWKSAK